VVVGCGLLRSLLDPLRHHNSIVARISAVLDVLGFGDIG
jgi:hypothetical protein